MRHKKKARPRAKGAYQAPALKVYGDLKSTTLAKKGASWDGGGKPRTRASGGNA